MMSISGVTQNRGAPPRDFGRRPPRALAALWRRPAGAPKRVLTPAPRGLRGRPLRHWMPLWPKHEIKTLISSNFGKNDVEKQVTDEDVHFLENMITTRTGNYTNKDIVVSQ